MIRKSLSYWLLGFGLAVLAFLTFLVFAPRSKASEYRKQCYPIEIEPTSTPTESPEPTPTIEPTPTETPLTHVDTYSPAGIPALPECKEIHNAPTILTFKRLDPGSISVKWTRVEDYVHTYLIWYGPSESQLLWNTFATNEYAELHSLPANQHIWVKVAGTHEGCIGPFSLTLDP